ncbi:hypothetical protein PHYSODRAFT_472559 [Phytophthora sojae]|uniref:Uncharacterized protein n=1 Tax=Phytophthora sojae (strain P6497) TaxID=1094619 RepID=G4YP68_PHYSP|nr:hypothetical protein PHYSODRAFT_472559 [Phytophthora sojae]EGZ27202.1 hypothetical protein PHYSODRAFT_472559 [Phytophthora sojae]|eukprot:XP_009514477.1 hypothetical protein PHYSODRAFT_472559 [Phytophthora sojae]
MEVESTRVHVRPDGKKLIDVTLRRQGVPSQQAPLVVPRFDDEDDSSSSDSDDEEPAIKSTASLNKRHYSIPSNNNNEDDHGGATVSSGKLDQGQTFQGEVQWDHVQELQELTNANATLTSEARDLRQQVKALQIQLEAQAPVPGLDADAVQDILLEKDILEHDVRDVKIVHQAKTLRTLKRSLQHEKQIAADAVKQCKTFEAANKKLEDEVDTLKLKLQRFQARAAADKKLCEELKSKSTSLQQELKKTQRALVREVGDDVPLEDIIGNTDNTASGASRRGRAQHIIMLKAKVKKLQAQLASVKPGTTSVASQDSADTTTVLDVDQRAQQDLSGQQIHRQKLLDQLTSQRDELQERIHRLTRKYDALKARAQILDREKQETRNKFQVLVEKSRTDDALVDALQRQLEAWKAKLHEARRARTADGMKASANADERAELERLRKIVAEHKSRGGDRATVQSNTMMPQPSEASQYRAMAVRGFITLVRSIDDKAHPNVFLVVGMIGGEGALSGGCSRLESPTRREGQTVAKCAGRIRNTAAYFDPTNSAVSCATPDRGRKRITHPCEPSAQHTQCTLVFVTANYYVERVVFAARGDLEARFPSQEGRAREATAQLK